MNPASWPRNRWPVGLGSGLLLGMFLGLAGPGRALELRAAPETGAAVAVVYNDQMPESKAVADHYARRRGVPAGQVLGLRLPQTGEMSRVEFREDLQKPLLKWFEKTKLFTFRTEVLRGSSNQASSVVWKVVDARVRYLVLCYGVPFRVVHDPLIQEAAASRLPQELRRNEAAVDSELALLPAYHFKLPLTGPVRNPLFGATNAADLTPPNGLLMVTRLDGPSADIARGLVDKSMEAETNGLWGRAYFDLQAPTNEQFKLGEEWIRHASEAARLAGFESVVDTQPATFADDFPMSQIALYAGWYELDVTGPFRGPKVEFMPGAVAYHLHSLSAHDPRNPTRFWCGPFLAGGATATLGTVAEPYLEATPRIGLFFLRFLGGCSLGEAAYACQEHLSWQTAVIGDPLYRPAGRPPRQRHEDLQQRQSKLIAWSHLKVVNLNLAAGYPAAECIAYLQAQPETPSSTVLSEKLADLLEAAGQAEAALKAWRQALAQDPSPQERVRLTLRLAQALLAANQTSAAYDLLKKFVEDRPDVLHLRPFYDKLIDLARKLDKPAEAESWQKALERQPRR